MLGGKTILVTGAARGLGRAIAREVAGQGADVVLADIDTQGGEETAAMIADSGGGARFVAVDLADPASIKALGADLAEHGKGLHGLVNNGAIATGVGGKPLQQVEIDLWDKVMQVNVRGLWLMTRAVLPLLAATGAGRIVNIASDTALWGAPDLLPYVASKGAVMAMTRSMARELGPQGIGVTAIAPGILTTRSTEYVPRSRHELYRQGRAVPGAQAPEDVVATVSFLLGEAALTLTGQTLPTNRGFVFK